MRRKGRWRRFWDDGVGSRDDADDPTCSEEQSQGIRQVNQALEELNQMTMENAQYSEVNAKSSSQLSKQAEELLAVVHQFRLWEEEERREETEHNLAALPHQKKGEIRHN